MSMNSRLLLSRLVLAAAGIAAIIGQIRAQSPTTVPPKFDVVSIRPCEDPRQHQVPGDTYPPRGHSSPGNLRTNCYPLHDDHGMGLIRAAYATDPFTPIDGGPSWVHSAFYEINAKAEGNPTLTTMRGPMMQVLLEEYFHLKIHHETAEGPVYFLTLARGGPKLRSFKEGSCVPFTTFPRSPLEPGQEYCNAVVGIMPNGAGHAEAQGTTLDEFSKMLRPVLDRPVINKTGLNGKFDIHIEFSREGTLAALPRPSGGLSAAPDPQGPSSIFTVFEEQLGLKLESGKGPVDRLVIDHIEKPSGN